MISIRRSAPALAALVLLVAVVTITAMLLRDPTSPLVILSEDEIEDTELEEEAEEEQGEEEEEEEGEEERDPQPDAEPTEESTPEVTEDEDEEVAGARRAEDEGEEGRGRAARLAGEHPGQGRGVGPRGPGHGATVSTYARETSWQHFPQGGCERGQAIAAVARGEYEPEQLTGGLPSHLAERCVEEG